MPPTTQLAIQNLEVAAGGEQQSRVTAWTQRPQPTAGRERTGEIRREASSGKALESGNPKRGASRVSGVIAAPDHALVVG